MNRVSEQAETSFQKLALWSYINDWIIKVQVPLPFSLRWVNSYILLQHQKFAIIDPGLHTREAVAVWQQVLEELELKWAQCSAVVVTHQHPDHYGLAGYVQAQTGAPVYMTALSKTYTDKLWGVKSSDYEESMSELLVQHAVPNEVIQGILDHLRSFQERVEPQPNNIQFIEAGTHITLGKSDWLIVHTEGHAFGGIMLYSEQDKIMICGDQVLPKISPHVGVVAGEDRPVLLQFLENLKEISKYDVSLVLPGHREPFTEYQERINSLLAHHDRRLETILSRVSELAETNAYQCTLSLFGKHLLKDSHSMRFALTEIIAHLEHLTEQGFLIRRVDKQGIIIYLSKMK